MFPPRAVGGAKSFNAKAGMPLTGDFASFIYCNKPFGSGGELSTQVALNPACHIDHQA